MLITIYVKGHRITIGEIENKIFKKTVEKSKHLFRKPDSWGFDYRALIDVILPQVKLIVIYDKEEKLYYATIPATFGIYENDKFVKSTKIEIRHYNKNGENLAQVFLPRRYWLKSKYDFDLDNYYHQIEVDMIKENKENNESTSDYQRQLF